MTARPPSYNDQWRNVVQQLCFFVAMTTFLEAQRCVTLSEMEAALGSTRLPADPSAAGESMSLPGHGALSDLWNGSQCART